MSVAARSQDSAFNARWRILVDLLEDARRESTPAEWAELLALLEERLDWYRRRDRLAQWGAV